MTGVFQINKPYFDLDRFNIYRLVGHTSNRSVEFSLTGDITGSPEYLPSYMRYVRAISSNRDTRSDPGSDTQNGPHAATIEAHTHHPANSAGNQCIAGHMPKIEQTIANVNVASHTFHFVTPATTESLNIPNACNVCHNDKSTAWAIEAMKSWPDRAPWRISQ